MLVTVILGRLVEKFILVFEIHNQILNCLNLKAMIEFHIPMCVGGNSWTLIVLGKHYIL